MAFDKITLVDSLVQVQFQSIFIKNLQFSYQNIAAKLKFNAISIEKSDNRKTLLKIFSLFAKFYMMISPEMAPKP